MLLSAATTSDLVGREPAKANLRRVVDAVAGGRGRLVLITGEPGVGKSALADYGCAYASGLGAGVIRAACWDGDGVPGFWPWQQVLRQVAAGADAPDGSDLDVLSAEPPAAPVVAGDVVDARRFQLFCAVVDALRLAATRRLLVVVVDDLHWADAGTVRLLGFAARQLRHDRVLLMAAYRETGIDDGPLDGLPVEAETVALRGLDVAATGELVHRSAVPAASELAAAVHQRTGGNPFFIAQVLALLKARAQSDPTAERAFPAAVGEAIRQRLDRLPAPTVDLLEAASVIGAEFDTPLLATVAGIGYAETMTRLEPAVRAGTLVGAALGCHRFAHGLVREFLYGRTPDAYRTRTHHAVAVALRDRHDVGIGTALGELAHHYALAVPAADPAVAAEFAVAAADHATARLAYEEAVRHWRQAIRLADLAGTVSLEMRLKSAEAMLCAGEHAPARDAFVAVAGRAASVGDAPALAVAALGLHRLGAAVDASGHEVIDVLDLARARLADGGPSALYARVLAALARELAGAAGADPQAAQALAEQACAVAHASGDQAAVASCLLARHDVGRAPGTATRRLAIADEMATAAAAGDLPELLFQARFCRFAALLELADPRALAELRTLDGLATQQNLPRPRYLVLSRQAMFAHLHGSAAAAHRLGGEAARFAELIGEPDGVAVHAGQRLVAALCRDGWAGVAEVSADVGDRAVPPELTPLFRAMVALGVGDRPSAEQILRALPPQLDGSANRSQALAAAAFDIEVAMAVGLTQRCADYYERLLPYADELVVIGAAVAVLGPVSLYLGMAATADRRWNQAIAHLDNALAIAERLGARPIATRVRARLGVALLGRNGPNDRTRARLLLSEAADVADELGLDALRDELVVTLTDGAAAAPDTPIFRLDGEVWTLGYAGRTAQLRDAKGLRDLAALLAVPRQEIPATQLLAGVGAPEQPRLGGDEVIDEQARAAYKKRLVDLDEEIAESDAAHDAGRLARYTAEREALIEELTRAYGLGGRTRRLGDPGERARTTVTARIRDALRRIERVHPELGAHLRASVVTGRACRYHPSTPLRWQL